MFLWLILALMTAAVVAALLRPLAGVQAPSAASAFAADIAIYKDQLAEIDADVARGILQPAEAETARREVSRRLLAHADIPAELPATRMSPRALAAGIAAVLPLAALSGYLWLGSPGLPAQPYAERAAAPLASTPVADLVAKVEARLAQNPADGQGWDVIAPVYFRLERFADAAAAFARAGALLGETNTRLAGFAEATVMANNGLVTDVARQAYEKLLLAQPDRVEPKFWLALGKEQDGKHAEAAADYRALLATAPPGANWRSVIEERLAAVETPTSSAAKPDPRGPTAADVKAADGMSETDRGQMVRGMVDSLAKRLEANPNDVQGWVRLVQSYTVLGEREKAVAALGDARRKLAGNAAALGELSTLAKSLGLGS